MHPPAKVPSVPAPATPTDASVRPGWAKRLVAITFYLGLAPLLRPFRFDRSDSFLRHHSAHALATILTFFAAVLGSLLVWLALSYLLVYQRDLYEGIPALGLDIPVRDGLLISPFFVAWLPAWLGGLVVALLGSRRTLPVIGRLTRRPFLLRMAFAGNTALLAVVAIITAIALHASSLNRDDDEPAAVYVLYDDMGFVPRWAINVGFYRISLAARDRWGPGNVVVAPLDEHHLRLALHHGKFVFLACHGADGEITMSRLRIAPPALAGADVPTAKGLCIANVDADDRRGPWTFLKAEQNLRFVYNAACDCGTKSGEWQQALAPAEVQTFGRLSAVVEHVVWLWSAGPRRIREME
jgi:hypothetical protein